MNSENYVTLFNSAFLPQGLALHSSMCKHIPNFLLWILCVDDLVYEQLTIINLSNVKLLKLSELETSSLINVKPNRTIGEYCWTLTPFAPEFVFNANPLIKRVTYLDCDVWFTSNPQPAFNEFVESGKSALITKHAFYPAFDYSFYAGIYCVQFIIFNRDSLDIIKNWQDKCIEWCFNRYEDGKFGDQLYLNDWSILFPDRIHVLSYGGYTLAPWNAMRYPYSDSFLFHFQALRLLSHHEVLLGPALPIPSATIKYIYQPYLTALSSAVKVIESFGYPIIAQSRKPRSFHKIISLLKSFYRYIRDIGRLRIVKI